MKNYKRIQLGLIHVAVAMTLVPINSTLNRVMIKELALSATLVSILASLPYFLSPLQVAIGAYSDRHPIFGYRRSPYILIGLFLCALGVIVSPQVAYLIVENPALGYFSAALAFGAWGMGYNLASVSYLSLASELSGEDERGRTIAVMWFMMIVSVILTAISLGNMLEVYSPAALQNAFGIVGIAALGLGLAGLIKLEPASVKSATVKADTYPIKEITNAILANKQAVRFFIYLWLLLAALLGQDVLLEPFAAQAFGLTVEQTTHITSAWGTFVLIAILIAGALEKRVARKTVAQIGNVGALIGFLVIIVSGFIADKSIFYFGVSLLGAGTGLSTVANLALMFDLTVPEKMGLYIGAWGFSNAISRLTGVLLSGVMRDVVAQVTGNPLSGYIAVFATLSLFLVISVSMLFRIDITEFRAQALSPAERAAMVE